MPIPHNNKNNARWVKKKFIMCQQTGFESLPAFHWLMSMYISIYTHRQIYVGLLLPK